MFVDIIGASEVSNHKRPSHYADFVRGFQTQFCSVCEKYAHAWYERETREKHIQWNARGDEGLLLMYAWPARSDVGDPIDVAINIALELKRRWLCSLENADRVNSGLLPIDLAVGIHAGPTCLKDGKPEGYAINLAKRVESHSREGTSTHIFLSEAAHGQVLNLADEQTYLFDESQFVSPKGISQRIRVYEVKHHFLPSDWTDEAETDRRSKTLLDPDTVELDIVRDALKINPTNLWLAEELIRSSMLKGYANLTGEERDDSKRLKEVFSEAYRYADMLRQADQRDAGVMFILGLVHGERREYEMERGRYEEAKSFSSEFDLVYWYLGQSYSYELYERLRENVDIPYKNLSPKSDIELANKAIECLSKAQLRQPSSAWMKYDYGCELIRWNRNMDEMEAGLSNIAIAVKLLPTLAERIADEPYLRKVLKKPIIKKLLHKRE